MEKPRLETLIEDAPPAVDIQKRARNWASDLRGEESDRKHVVAFPHYGWMNPISRPAAEGLPTRE